MKQGQAGYTLIEMLVALAITGLLAAMILAGLSSSGQVVTRLATQTSAEDGIVTAQRLLRRQLEAVRPTLRLDGITPAIDAQGDEATFTFIAPPLDRAQPDALWRYRILATASGDLMLYHMNVLDRRHDVNNPSVAGWSGIKLAENIGTMRINYFGRDPISAAQRWQTRWFRRPQLPDLVRIAVQFRSGDTQLWPDLIVHPRATVNTACRIDALTGRCDVEA